MIITVWWEDARNRVRPRSFGPQNLLVACVADELGIASNAVAPHVDSHPLKGDANVLRKMEGLRDLPIDPNDIVIVLDRDRVYDAVVRWTAPRPTNCIQGICTAIHAKVAGDYDLVLLVNNMESLFDACCDALRRDRGAGKPDPMRRDDTLNAVAFGMRQQRADVRAAIPSFDRLVARTARRLRELDLDPAR